MAAQHGALTKLIEVALQSKNNSPNINTATSSGITHSPSRPPGYENLVFTTFPSTPVHIPLRSTGITTPQFTLTLPTTCTNNLTPPPLTHYTFPQPPPVIHTTTTPNSTIILNSNHNNHIS
jgi:hypothetical protein